LQDTENWLVWFGLVWFEGGSNGGAWQEGLDGNGMYLEEEGKGDDWEGGLYLIFTSPQGWIKEGRRGPHVALIRPYCLPMGQGRARGWMDGWMDGWVLEKYVRCMYVCDALHCIWAATVFTSIIVIMIIMWFDAQYRTFRYCIAMLYASTLATPSFT